MRSKATRSRAIERPKLPLLRNITAALSLLPYPHHHHHNDHHNPNTILAIIPRSFALASLVWALVSASFDPSRSQHNLIRSRRHLPTTTTTNMSTTDGTGITEDNSPPMKRVRMNPTDVKDGVDDQSSQGAAAQSASSRPAFLTPPTSASIPAPPPSSSTDAVLTHDNLYSNAASDSPKAEHSQAYTTPRGGGGGGGGGADFSNNCDSGRSPAGIMSKSEIRNLMQREAGYDIDDPQNMPKREGYLTWDDYFMAVASLSAQRSKDPHSQVGACIVDEDNRIVGIGYNGFPRGCPDDCLPWAANAISSSGPSNSSGSGQNEEKKTDDDDNASSMRCQPLSILHTRDPFMCHAEVNAILNKCSADVAGSRMYVARFPCNECAKVIIQSRIQEVVYLEDGSENDDAYRAARIMFQMAGVLMRKYNATRNSITLDFGPLVSQKEGEVKSSSSKISDITKDGDGSGDGHESSRASAAQTKHRDLLLREANYDPTGPSVVPKRGGYLSWDTYFMAVSFLSAQRSKDPNTQVGACIVDENKCIIGIGYNGFPRGCSDECLPWSRKAKSELHKKYCYVAHAEVNAILNKCSADVRGATIYVALFPCNDCAKVIIQAGIREVVYLNDYYHDTDGCRASRIMFEMAGVKTRQYQPETRSIVVDL